MAPATTATTTAPTSHEPTELEIGVPNRSSEDLTTKQGTSKARKILWAAFTHAWKHTGVGIVCSVAYFDPGNWGVDLQAGSEYGYRLLFVVLLAGFFAAFLQVLASRLGCVTGLDLASHCRLLLHSRARHTKLIRYAVLYPLYVLSEIAIISTDLAELLGSAIALCMLFPRLPLWAGVLLTGFDVLLLLMLRDPLKSRPVKMFEILMTVLMLAVLICMAIIIAKVDVDWGDAFLGYVPSKAIFQSGGLYTSVGILGATVMPHSLFLGSALATQDRLSKPKPSPSTTPVSSSDSLPYTSPPPRPNMRRPWRWIKAQFHIEPTDVDVARPRSHTEHVNNCLSFVKAHVYHGIVDMVMSLLGFAVVINSMILILASAVFHYGPGRDRMDSSASLFDAHDLIREIVGQAAATLFAIALLASGQSASIVATLAGQSVSSGFLSLSISPVLRRLVTRLLGLIPSMAVALAIGRPGIDSLLVVSQVVLSIVLPFIVAPLIWLTSSGAVMGVRDESKEGEEGTVDFSSGWVMTAVGCVILAVVVLANAYVLVSLAMGTSG